MNVENYISPATMTWKLGVYMILIFGDIGLQCGVYFADMMTGVPSDTGSINGPFSESMTYFFVLSASSLQVAIQLTLIFWYFFLVWKTFLFRFGLLKQLILYETPVVMFVPINFALYFIERGLRLYYIRWSKINNMIDIYDNTLYMIAFWIRNLFVVFMCAASIYAAIKIGHPSYYKP